MRTAVLASSLSLALLSLGATTALAAPARSARSAPPSAFHFERVSPHSQLRVATDGHGHRIHSALPIQMALTPADFQAAYKVDTTLGAGKMVAVIEGSGYADLEADLAHYRSTYGLPPCTIASGCLTAINDSGETTPLPPDDPDFIVEAALDVDMISAVCPSCKIVVVEGSGLGANILLGQETAARFPGMTSISDSYGGPEGDYVPQEESSYNTAGVGGFVSSGDDGYTGATPSYPATSAYVIAVGGTELFKDETSSSGYSETVWNSFGGAAGSSCSKYVPSQPWSPSGTSCSMRATADISAAADNINVYVSSEGGFMVVSGTSASAPLAAATFAAAGHGDTGPAFVYKHPEIWNDVTMGSNGSCGNTLCDAGAGWDGPTGLGTLDQSKLIGIGNVAGQGPDVAFTFPTDGTDVDANFSIEATAGSAATYLSLDIDGAHFGNANITPYEFDPTGLADGDHMLTLTSHDIDGNTQSTSITVHQATGGGDDSGGGGGGCSTGGGAGGGAGVLLALGLAMAGRRRTA